MPTYLKYVLIALAVILLSAVLAFFEMKKARKVERKNCIYLAACTVLAMICIALAPLLADLLAKILNFSHLLSILISVALLVLLSVIIFLEVQRKMEKVAGDVSPDTSDDLEVDVIDALLEEAAAADSANEEAKISHEEAAIESDADRIRFEFPAEEAAFEEADSEEANAEETPVGEALAAVAASEAVTDEITIGEAITEDTFIEEAASAEYVANESVALEAANENGGVDKPSVEQLLLQAQDNKHRQNYAEAIRAYQVVLSSGIDDVQLLQWVVVDFCALCKKTQRTDDIHNILEKYQNFLKPEIRDNILRNL